MRLGCMPLVTIRLMRIMLNDTLKVLLNETVYKKWAIRTAFYDIAWIADMRLQMKG